MTSSSASNPMSPKERVQYGAFIVRHAAFDAVYGLWRRRHSENWTRKQAADSIGVDEGWYSKQFQGPRNWTMETLGALIQSLNGDIEIIVKAIEDVEASRSNHDAYAEMDDLRPPSQDWTKESKTKTEGTGKFELLPA